MTGGVLQHLKLAGKLIVARFASLLTLVLLGSAPLYGAYAVLTTWTPLTIEAADQLFGLLGILIMPLVNGAIVYLLHHEPVELREAITTSLKASARVWTRMVAAYMFLGLAVIAALAVALLPPGFVLLLLVQNKLASPDIGWVLAPFAVVGVLWVLPRYVLLEPLILFDDCEPYSARTVSRDLTKAVRWPITLAWVLTVGPTLGLEAIASRVAVDLETALGWPQTLVAPAIGLLSSLLYLVPLGLFYVVWREGRPPAVVATPAGAGGGRVLAFPRRGST